MAAVGVCALILTLLFMPEQPGELYGVLLSAAALFGVLLLGGICLTVCGIGLFINIAYWLLFLWLGFSLFIIPYYIWDTATYFAAAVVVPLVLLYRPMRRLTAEAERSCKAEEKLSELAEKIYGLAAPDFELAESLSAVPAAYRAHTEGEILTVYNITVYEGYDLLMTRCLRVTARLSQDASLTSRVTNRLRRVRNAFFAGFTVDGGASRLSAFIYYSPAFASGVYRSVRAVIRAYDRSADVVSVRDADWSIGKSLIPEERFVLYDINEIICSAAENENMLDCESELYFHIVLHSEADVESCAAAVSERGCTAFYAYGEDVDYLLILTRLMTVNKDSLDACTDMLSDIAQKYGGKVGTYGYGFDETEKRKELEEFENILR